MHKLVVVLMCLVAVAICAPQGATNFLWNPVGHNWPWQQGISPYAAVPGAVPYAMGGAYFGHAPYPIPAPYAYHSGFAVRNSVEPVEQHGYHIAY